MKTFNKLSNTEKTLLSNKAAISYNSQMLTDIFKFVLTKISDPELLQAINDLLESFLDNLDNIISKHLHSNETDNKKNSNCSPN